MMKRSLYILSILLTCSFAVKYDLAWGTTWVDYSGTNNPVVVVITGDTGEKTAAEEVPVTESPKPLDETHVIYQRDIGKPTCVSLKLNGNDNWIMAQFQVKKEGDDTWYTTGAVDYEFKHSQEKEFCDLKPAIAYSLAIVTSRTEWAGNDAYVFVTLHGKDGESTRKRFFDDTGRNDYVAGAIDEFYFNDIDIGTLDCIEVTFKTRSDPHDEWKLDRIEVELNRQGRTILYKTKSVEEWFRVKETKKYCNLIVEDPCKCDSPINDNWELKRTEFDLQNTEVEDLNPIEVDRMVITNNENVAQSTQFQTSEDVTETSSFTQTYGIGLTVETTFQVGVPLLTSGEFTAGLSFDGEWSIGKEQSKSQTYQSTFNCIAPPKTTVTCVALLSKYKAKAKYTQTWTHKAHKCSCKNGGELIQAGGRSMTLEVNGKKIEDAVIKTKLINGALDELDGQPDTVPNVKN